MTAACDLPIDLSTKSRHHHHHHHPHHHGRHLPMHHRLVQLDHEQLQQLHYEYLSHQQLTAALANHPLNRLYAASNQNHHHRHHLEQLERLEQLQLAATNGGSAISHQLLNQHQTNLSNANGAQTQDGSQNVGAPASELDNPKSQFMSANFALNINVSSPPSLNGNSQQNSDAQLEALSNHQHHLQLSQQLASHHQHLQQLQLAAAAAAESHHHLHHHHLTHSSNPDSNSNLHHHHHHHNLAHLHLGHHHHQLHPSIGHLHHHDLAKLTNSASALSTASLASSTLSSASSSSSSSASSVSSSSNEAASPEVQDEGPLDATIGHHHLNLQSVFNAERQLQAGILSHSNHHHHHHETALHQHKAESPPAHQLNQQLSLNQLNATVSGDARGSNGGDRDENPSPIDLHRSSTSSTVSTMSSPSSSSASITSNSSSMNLQLNDKKRINRPLTGKHVKHGTGASIHTLATLRKVIRQRQQQMTNLKA